MSDLKYVVYITTNQCNGKFYIGVHRTNPNVFDGYIGCGVANPTDLRNDTPFAKAVKKYGYNNFKRTILVEFPDTEAGRADAYMLEAQLVNERSIRSKMCYNATVGGRGGEGNCVHKRVYQFDLRGNFLRSYKTAGEAAALLGVENIYSATKAIRNCCLGTTSQSFDYYWSYTKKFVGKEKKYRISQYTIDGKFLRTWDSIAEAENMYKISTIFQAISRGFTSAGYQWRRYNGTEDDIPSYISNSNKNYRIPVVAINKETGEITEASCVKELVEKLPQCSMSQINRVLKKIIKSHRGFIFKYKDEDIV